MVLVIMFIGSIVFALLVPAAMKRAHIRRQDRLLDRCRALFVLAVQAIEHTNEAAARSYLVRIRRIEARWQYGNSMVFRVAFALWAIGVGIVGYTFLRALALLPLDNRLPTSADIRRFAEMAPLFGILAGLASLHAMTSYFGARTPWWAINDCGDRLERMLNSERHVATVSEADAFNPIRNDLTPRQIFGLGPDFTRRQLDRARRRLVTQLHPDLAYGAQPAVRRAREEALKRVNAAYDQLRSSAL